MSDDWLAQLRQLHDADKTRLQAEDEQQQAAALEEQSRSQAARDILNNLKAHELMREVQKALLDGKGTLSLKNDPKNYDLALILAWQGSVGDARRPTAKDSHPIYYISIGVKDTQLWVNDKKIAAPTPDKIKTALLAAAQHPAMKTKKERSTENT
jgi:hypothetical protein